MEKESLLLQSWASPNGRFIEKLKSMVLKCNYNLHLKSNKFLFIFLLAGMILISSCKVSYSFSGASISPQVKSISVQYFQNRASLVQPALSQLITEALIDKCRAQTNLKFTKDVGDVNFEGAITGYNTMPLTVAADARAAMNRFTISVSVKFTNIVEPELSFEQTFSRYEDYDSSIDLSQVEDELSRKIVELIIEDIFNRAFANW